ncbi:hypothetical protein PROFUN_08757 [Planoprotostelium fungivorum]|uniref:Uncharacterized protein n=1 Tax=Planoprotostelium fungivorum TaxID=1890364 RepID=A0A2P6ND55_9EUKA|nr:hypothetical protein PROFUN_08757 [Planoprotostelium fungivorum]
MEVSKDYNLLCDSAMISILKFISEFFLLLGPNFPNTWTNWLLKHNRHDQYFCKNTSEDPKDQAPIENIRRICREILDDLFSIGTFVQFPEIFYKMSSLSKLFQI